MSDPVDRPQDPCRWAAPLPSPRSHRVVVRPGAVLAAIHVAVAAICLAGGVGVLLSGILVADAGGRGLALVVGGLITLVGVALCASLTVVLRPRTFTFTAEAFVGTLHGRPLRVPWSQVAEVKVRARTSGPNSRAFLMRPMPMPYASLHLQLLEGATIDGPAAGGRLSVPFWNRIPLIHSFTYGCRTFAGDRFRGVVRL